MGETKEALDVAEDNIQEVEEATTVKEEPKGDTEVKTESPETQEDKKPNRREKVKSKLDEKDSTIEELNAKINTIIEQKDQELAASKYGEEVFENEKVKAYKENLMSKDGSPISWSEAAEMAGLSQKGVPDSYYVPGAPASSGETEQKELSMDELEAKLEKDIAEGKIQI